MTGLRDQIADALFRTDVWGQLARRADRNRFADAAMTVVQPELDRQAAAFNAAIVSTASDAMEHRLCNMTLMGVVQRAEQAEADMRAAVAEGGRLTVLRNAADAMARIRLRMVNTQRQRTERAEAALERVREAIHIADRADVTDWQRGYRACADHVVAAVLDLPEQP